jgi:hypothetical protein
VITSHLRCTARDNTGTFSSSATARARTAQFTRTVNLDLAFHSEHLRDICEKYAVAKRELGEDTAAALIGRLADLRSAASIYELPAGQPRLLLDASEPTVVVDLTPGQQLSFCANHTKKPLTEQGELDWTRVSRIRILGIGITPS